MYGSGSDPLAETNGSGAITAEYVYLNGKRIARIDADASVHYYLSDALKSTSMVINAATGNAEEESGGTGPFVEIGSFELRDRRGKCLCYLWKTVRSDLREGEKSRMVGTGRFELPTPRTPSRSQE